MTDQIIDSMPEIIAGFALPKAKAGGERVYYFDRLEVGGGPAFVSFNGRPRNRTLRTVQAAAKSWCTYKSDTCKVATRVINHPVTGEEGIGVWKIAD